MEYHYPKKTIEMVWESNRADDSTPARRAFNYYIAPYQRHHDKPVSIWVSIIRSNLKKLNLICYDPI